MNKTISVGCVQERERWFRCLKEKSSYKRDTSTPVFEKLIQFIKGTPRGQGRTQQLRYASTTTSHAQLSNTCNVCTCIYHQNVILALDGLHAHIPNIPVYNKEFTTSCVVKPESDSCWFNECQHQNCGLQAFYLLPDDEDLVSKIVKWMGWEEVNGHIIKTEHSGSIFDLQSCISVIMKPFLTHCFIKRKQCES